MSKIQIKKITQEIIEWLIYIVGYAVILTLTSFIFKSAIQIDNSYFGLWGLVASFIIYFLNKTIKPIIVRITIPLTAMTFGIFYPFINFLILKIVDILLFDHFQIKGIIVPYIAAVVISFLNLIMDDKIIKPMLRKEV
ncbi:phage holin family protein [bacterium]|nr:phage holin family protein [bacterium]